MANLVKVDLVRLQTAYFKKSVGAMGLLSD